MGLSRNVRAAVEDMVYRGRSRKEAAEAVGIKETSLYQALRNPQVLKHYNDCLDVLRTSERPKSVHKIASLRDKAESERVQLEAAKYLDGGDRRDGGVQVNVGISIQPGYVVDVSGGQSDETGQLLKLAGSTRNVLDLQADVPDE